MIDINSSLLIQVGLFIFLMLVLNQIFFKPFLRFLEERQEKIQGDERKAVKLQEEAEQYRLQFEEGMDKGQLQALDEKGRIQEAGAQESKRVIDTAQQEVAGEMPKIKAQIAQESKQALTELEGQQGVMAKEIVEKILGRSLQ
jgi:F-type H+-transporting ATPase subunit b